MLLASSNEIKIETQGFTEGKNNLLSDKVLC